MYTIKINTKEYRTFCLHECDIYKDMVMQQNIQSLETATQNTQELSALVSNVLLQLKYIMHLNDDKDKLYDIVLETNNRNIVSLLNTKSNSKKKIKKFSQYCRSLAGELNIKVEFTESKYPRLLQKFDTVLWCSAEENDDDINIRLKLNSSHMGELSSKLTYTNKGATDKILLGLETAIELALRYKTVNFKISNKSLILVDDYRVIELLEDLNNPSIDKDRIKNLLYNLRLLNCDIGLISEELNLAKEGL